MAKSLIFFSMFLLTISGSLSAAEKLDEATARTLIVRQLLSLVDGHIPSADQAEGYRLCTYRDSFSHNQMMKHLAGVKVDNLPLVILDKQNKKAVGGCNALYVNKPQKGDLDWFRQNGTPQNTLFIINGRDYAEQGFHIGLFLNNRDTFDFELNPEAFEESGFTPRKELLQFGQVLESGLQKRVKLLRNLINFTDWPGTNSDFETSETFDLCLYRNQSLATFIDYFSRRKPFKSKALNTKLIVSIEQADGCDAIILNDPEDTDHYRFIADRDKEKKLLIGNDMTTSAAGVHYNLVAEKSTGRLFEMNLIAFQQTGHSPHFELINSAKLVNTDYPEIARVLDFIIQSTTWPKKQANQLAGEAFNVCVYQQPAFSEYLGFLLENKASEQESDARKIILKNIEESNLSGCEATLVSEDNWQELTAGESTLISEAAQSLTLLLTEKRLSAPGIHYQMLIAPKRIKLEINQELLNSIGFKASESLIDFERQSGGGR
ncbi:YfiR/HmsC family protein [Aliikangiella marina]|uniref:YfiR/HmsC family protein n=1 Tax=Aliikangiella marina TaxID=1712262 RepID=UPI00163DD623|nr:YfiR/HmsC family protein [Aliikangiella marina]